jgi:hypothetical protein
VLAGAESASGCDREKLVASSSSTIDFAEYYLLGTLASVAIASISAFAAAAALGSLA